MMRHILVGALVVLSVCYLYRGLGAPLWMGFAMLGVIAALLLK